MNDNAFETDAFETDFELYGEQETGYEGEDQELELAAELLAVSGDRELDEFFKKLMGGVRGVLATPAGQQLKGLLRDTAKQALPLAGQAIGTYFNGKRGRGPEIGRQAGNLAGSILGLELEGMSGEDQELEAAKQIVRLANDAVQNLAAAPRGANPQQTAQKALATAAQRHAPGLVPQLRGSSNVRTASGRWYRRGSRIVVVGV